MPRRFAACLLLLAACLCCLSACTRHDPPQEPVAAGFECDVALHYRDMDVKGHLTRVSAGTLKMDIAEPASLKGMTMEWDGETISVKMYGMTFGVDPATIPESALGKGLLDVFDAIVRKKDGGTLTDEGLKTAGDSLNGEFEVLSDPTTGSLLSMKIPELNLSAEFSNFQVTTNA